MTMIRNFVKFAVNKYSYPHAHVAFGSRLAGQTTLGSDVEISRRCYLNNAEVGNHVRIDEDCTVFDSTLQDHTALHSRSVVTGINLGSFSYIAERSQVSYTQIGRFCSVGPEFLCGYGDHPLEFVSTSPVFYSTRGQCGTTFSDKNAFPEHKETEIGHDVWIGARVFVRSGMKIGDGAIIAAGAAVVTDVPDYALVGGVPAKIIRYRFDEPTIKELLQLRWWNWPEADLRAAQMRFAQSDVQAFLDWARQR